MLLLCSALVSLCLLIGAWYLYEHRWDRRLFGHRSETNFVINVRARRAVDLVREQSVLPLDVRPASSYRAGHLPGAVNAPFENSLDTGALDGIDRTRPVLIYCDGGYRSRRSLPAIRAAGFTTVYHLHRGIMSWKMAKEPVESSPAT
jgi:rhodanese-related sulfurtransferase